MTIISATLNQLPEKAMIDVIQEVGKNQGLAFQQGTNFQAQNIAANPPAQVFNSVVLVCQTEAGINALGALLQRIAGISP